jgi:hypothetical protein
MGIKISPFMRCAADSAEKASTDKKKKERNTLFIPNT